MTLPDRCDVCAWPLMPWDPDDVCICTNCGSRVQPWEALSPEDSRRRMALIARREAIDEARQVAGSLGGMVLSTATKRSSRSTQRSSARPRTG